MAIELKGSIELKDIAAGCDAHFQADSEAQDLDRFLRNLKSRAAKDRPYSLRFRVEGLEELMAAHRGLSKEIA